jgi:AraC-like DNA-binding protein
MGRVRLWRAEQGSDAATRPGAHPTIELAWIEDGAVAYTVGRTCTGVNAGGAFVVPAGVEHATTFPTPVRAAALWLVPEVVDEIGDALGVRAARIEPGLVDGYVAALGRVLVREVASPQPGTSIAAEAIAEAMIVYALRTGRREPRVIRRPRDPRIRAALDAMHARYAEPLTVDDLARAAAMSRFHFSRLFRDEVGEAPYQHLLRVRIGRAAELLQNGRTSVTEAALAVGFHDFSRFSRTFRRFVGRLPVEVARGSREPRRPPTQPRPATPKPL